MNPKARFYLFCVTLLTTTITWQPLLTGSSYPEIDKHFSIYEKRDVYSAWPAIARAENGDLLVQFTRTEEHMSPNGEILQVRSTDNGETWQPPSIVYDTIVDDRESGLTVLRDGRLLTHLRSVKFPDTTYTTMPATSYPPELITRWADYVTREDYKNADHLHRAWQTISTDNGYTWSSPTPGTDSIHGGIQLADGSLLVASYRESPEKLGIYATPNPETPWEHIATIETPPEVSDNIRFGEPHILQLPSGRVILMTRATAKPYDDQSPLCNLWGTYSDDHGRTWAPPYETPLWGFPPHLTLLSDGRVLCTYGHRRPPYGQRACVSEDGVNWSLANEYILRDDAPNKDLGYPVSIELSPGKILTVYYQQNVEPGFKPEAGPPHPNRKKPGILGTIWNLPGYEDQADEVISIGSRRELFVDGFLIDKLENVRQEMHRPDREGVAFYFDKPWEGNWSAYPTVIKDGEIYRMYYRGLPAVGDKMHAVTCYAESSDGITWTKPNLGLYEVMGTRDNNVILMEKEVWSHNFSPFLDSRPGVPKSERFKAIASEKKDGLVSFASADGIHWKRWKDGFFFTDGMFDSHNVAFWSTSEKQYVCYFRTWTGTEYSGFRTIARTTSKDFIHWEPKEEMTYGNTPQEHLYTNGTHPYIRAPHIYIALAKRFFPDKAALSKDVAAKLVDNPDYGKASSDSIFMSTRGGNRYDRRFMEAFIRPGETLEDWVARDNTPALGVIQGNDRQLFMYRMSHYGQDSSHMTRYSLRLDGFASLSAPYQGGEITTKPFTFSGEALTINYASSAAGEIRVEIQDQNGQPIPGFTLSDCLPIFGDEIERTVQWDNTPSLSNLAEKPVRLRFFLKDADLFAIRFK
ncbi:MAG: exo-alpha-sialidase [Verrucomicrobia bacterium]|nr:exo-alpha-sialidase [Verrucomicrobiota bacterium]MDA1066239.1 exo-alpha-sialidase [Verrucomicrobiota bacterium]